MKPLFGMFASALKYFQDHTLAGDEVNGKNVDDFLREIGVPETPADKNTLLALAKSTANHSPGEPGASSAEYAAIPGKISDNFEACDSLRKLLDTGLESLSDTRKNYLQERSEAVVKQLIPLLEDDSFAIKLVHTLAGLGIFGTAGWLVWTAKEQAWKTGTWGVLVIGAIRLLGNLLYNDAAAVQQVWNMVYVHVGLGAVAYTLEILERTGIEFGTGTTMIIGTVLANLIPLLGFYFKDIWATGKDFFAKSEQTRSGRASDDDVELLRPILNALEAYTGKSKSLLHRTSASKPGNRTGDIAQAGQAETQRLIDALKWDVDPEPSQGWGASFISLLREATIKSPSLLYALFTGIFLFVAAIGDAKAVSDIAVLVLILIIEVGKGISNEHVTQDQMQYRVLKLTLGRFASIFFFAAPKINYRLKTGREDFFDTEPELAAAMAHANAAFICLLGLYVIPTFELFIKLFKRVLCRARALEAGGQGTELQGGTNAGPMAMQVPELLGDTSENGEDEDEEELKKWEEVMNGISKQAMGNLGQEMEKLEEEQDSSFTVMMAALGGVGYTTEADPEMMKYLGLYY
ncbi:hypothetical protein [Ensifer sp. YR511]|uniref:hypothetical protein n=1 Tax=Ensifer sp. YR511 TaxID=1855294 RepID=UPI000B7E44B3|nr:hypothetical protein [Ensifer sp. YR511]